MHQKYEREYPELSPSTNGNLAQIMLFIERESRGWAILRMGMCRRGSDEGAFCERECVEGGEAMNGNSATNGNSVASMMKSNGNN